MELSKLLSGNVLIGSRVIGRAKPNSDWDIVCTKETLELVKENGDIESIEYHEHGYEICEKLESNQDEEYKESDQGGFGADLECIAVIRFNNGLYINLFIYPNKRKFKLFKKLNKELLKLLNECKGDEYKVERQEWVDWFIELQYELGINKDLKNANRK